VFDQPITFRANDVRVIPLRDARSSVVGIMYPIDETQRNRAQDWAGKPNRTADHSYVPNYHHTMDLSDVRNFQPTPWRGRRPFYIQAHASSTGFAVKVQRGTGLAVEVKLDGRSHGRLIASNAYFQRASDANPARPVVYLSCLSASGPAAGDSADYLHEYSGHTGTVYAPNGVSTRIRRDQFPDFSFLGAKPAVDEHGNIIEDGEFRSYPYRS
jgi:hypothetical protein